MRYSVVLTVDASIIHEVDAEDEQEALDKALNEACRPSVCHHCSRVIEIGDVLDAIEATPIDG